MRIIQVAIIAAGIAAFCIWGKVYYDMAELHAENDTLHNIIAGGTAIMPPLPPRNECGENACSLVAPRPQTLARQNNNPLNIKGQGWKGQIGNDKLGHAIFESPEYGVRAAVLTLRSYAKKHKIQTVTEIVDRFCEANGKTKMQYIKHICRALGIKPDEKFNLIGRMPELLKAMGRFESGEDVPNRYIDGFDILAKL